METKLTSSRYVTVWVSLLLLIAGSSIQLRGEAPQGNSPIFHATATFTVTGVTINSVRHEGDNTIINQTLTGNYTGDFVGTFTDDFTVVVHADGSNVFHAFQHFVGSVQGHSGTLFSRFEGTGIASGTFEGQLTILSGGGDLEDLRGTGTFDGAGPTGTFAFRLHFTE